MHGHPIAYGSEAREIAEKKPEEKPQNKRSANYKRTTEKKGLNADVIARLRKKGLSSREIADMYDCNPSNVAHFIAKAREEAETKGTVWDGDVDIPPREKISLHSKRTKKRDETALAEIMEKGKTAALTKGQDDEKARKIMEWQMMLYAFSETVDAGDIYGLKQKFADLVKLSVMTGNTLTEDNAYLALGIWQHDIVNWLRRDDQERKKFAKTFRAFFASTTSTAYYEKKIDPAGYIWHSKTSLKRRESDGNDEFGDEKDESKRTAEEIAKTYSDVPLPD